MHDFCYKNEHSSNPVVKCLFYMGLVIPNFIKTMFKKNNNND